MAPRKKHLTYHQRCLVIDLVHQGNSYRKIEDQTGIPFTTVSSIVKKYNMIGTVADVAGRRPKRKAFVATDRSIILNVKKDRFVYE